MPRPVIAEAVRLGRNAGLLSLNAVVQLALEEFTEKRRREAFAAAIAEMGRDPDILRESAAITEQFRPAEADGIR